MKKLLVVVSLVAICCGEVHADNIYKASPQLAAFLQKRQMAAANSVSPASQGAQSKAYVEADETIGVLVRFSQAAPLVKWLDDRSYEVRTMLDHALTVALPVDSLQQLMALPEVEAVTAKNQRRLLLDKVRVETNAAAVHAGEGLLTPYTGKGVIVGVIDQGFDYTHPAFRNADGTSRILAAWRSEPGKYHKPLTTSQQILAAQSDSIKDATHGTHVLGIAAGGSHAYPTDNYGIAPDADLVLVSSEQFEDAEVIDGINYISKIAAQYGEPFVVNMSFGTNETAHNGKGAFAQSIKELCDNGALLVAAVGNSGNYMVHSRLAFSTADDIKYLYVPNKGQDMMVSFYSLKPDQFDATLYIYNKQTKSLEAKDSLWLLQNNCLKQSGVDESINQYYVCYELNCEKLFAEYNSDDYCVAFAVSGAEGDTVDAWIADNDNEFGPALAGDERFNCQSDADYYIASPADAEGVVAVAAHALRTSFTDLDGVSYSSLSAVLNDHADYSSHGPLVDEAVQKPTVSAPGTLVLSSLYNNRGCYTSNSSRRKYVNHVITYDDRNYYYGFNSGTSMASPVVAGAVALWLEACPDLTWAQVQDILKNTSVKDSFTGAVPNKLWGYGKLDIYAGLKEALLISGIPSARNTEAPFTLQPYGDRWQVLLNTDEDFVDARLVGLDGAEVWHRRIDNPLRGTDFSVPTALLPQGVYVLHLRSANSTQAHKVVVR